MKNYRQNDPRWANLPYAGGLMAASGCGSTSVADIVDLDSWIVAQWRASHSYASNGSGTYWGGIPAALRAFGVSRAAAQLQQPVRRLFQLLPSFGNSFAIKLSRVAAAFDSSASPFSGTPASAKASSSRVNLFDSKRLIIRINMMIPNSINANGLRRKSITFPT